MEEWDAGAHPLVDDGDPGVLVRAMYNFEGAERDKLTFKIGEELTSWIYRMSRAGAREGKVERLDCILHIMLNLKMYLKMYDKTSMLSLT